MLMQDFSETQKLQETFRMGRNFDSKLAVNLVAWTRAKQMTKKK